MKAFRRNRVPVGKKVAAAALCNSGYSYRTVAKLLGGISYIAVRDAFVSLATSMPLETRKHRREVAIDASEISIDGSRMHLWMARDVQTGEFLAFHGSPTGSAEDGSRFLASVASLCENRPYLRLGPGGSSPRGLLNLDLYFQENPAPSIMGRLGRLFQRS